MLSPSAPVSGRQELFHNSRYKNIFIITDLILYFTDSEFSNTTRIHRTDLKKINHRFEKVGVKKDMYRTYCAQ